MVRVDCGRDIAIPLLERRIDLDFGIRSIAIQEHHDALHEYVSVALLPREPSWPTIRAKQAEPFHKFFR